MHMGLIQDASSQNRVRTMCRLLFRLIDPSEAVRLLDECLNAKEKREVQSVLGQAFRLLIGQATGHYRLNLSEDMDRDVFTRLMAVNKDERAWLAQRYPGLDTSQHGNGHRFRNEKLNGSSIVITPKMIQAVSLCDHLALYGVASCASDRLWWCRCLVQLPDRGLIEFDFVAARRPSSRTKPMHSLAYYRLLKNAGVYDLLEFVGGDVPKTLGTRRFGRVHVLRVVLQVPHAHVSVPGLWLQRNSLRTVTSAPLSGVSQHFRDHRTTCPRCRTRPMRILCRRMKIIATCSLTWQKWYRLCGEARRRARSTS